MFEWVGEHTIYSKKVMAAVIGVATMIFLSQAVGAQSASDADGGVPVVSEGNGKSGFDESDIDFSSWGEGSSSQDSAGNFPAAPSIGIGVYVRMVFVLAVVVAAIILIFRFIKKSSGLAGVQDGDDTFLRHVSGVPLGAGKSVQIVTLVDKAYILGVSENNVNLIGEVEDKELVNAMNLWSDKRNRTSKPRSFADVLDLFMSKGPRTGSQGEGKSYSSGSTQALVDSLREQSKRFGEGESL